MKYRIVKRVNPHYSPKTLASWPETYHVQELRKRILGKPKWRSAYGFNDFFVTLDDAKRAIAQYLAGQQPQEVVVNYAENAKAIDMVDAKLRESGVILR